MIGRAAGLWRAVIRVRLHHCAHTWNWTNHYCKRFFFLRVNMERYKDKSLLLIEAAEALHCLHQQEHQLMVGTPHLLS